MSTLENLREDSDACETWIEAFARSAAIRKAGLYEAFATAKAAGDLEACDRMAAQAGCPYNPPLAAGDAP